MRTPLLAKAALRTQISQKVSYPPPVGGWNAKDSFFGMPRTDAVSMVNIFPDTSYVSVRYGATEWATGMTGIPKTLGVFTSLSGGQEMYATTTAGIYYVTPSGAVGASVLARTNGKHQCVNMGDGTNNWLMMFNGVDKPAYYNGATWTAVDAASTPALTGVTTTTLIGGMVFKGRLCLIEKDKLKFWYLASGAVGGALTAFDLTTLASRGGYLMAMSNWTYDGGAGQDDRAVFVTSEGEVIVYQGTDPATAADWALVGTYFFGKPIGRRCLCKYGGDLLILTEGGIVELSAALTGVVNESKYKLSDKIRQAFNQAALTYGSNFGWEMLVYPKENALIVNIPLTEDGTHHQYVMNLTTRAWCKFTGWNAEAFAIQDKQLYYCRVTKTAKAWDRSVTTCVDDGGNTFEPSCIPAFTIFGGAGFKNVKMVGLAVNSTYAETITMAPRSDYDVNSSGTSSTITAATGITRTWSAPAYSSAKAVSFNCIFSKPNTQWLSTDWMYEEGAGL